MQAQMIVETMDADIAEALPDSRDELLSAPAMTDGAEVVSNQSDGAAPGCDPECDGSVRAEGSFEGPVQELG